MQELTSDLDRGPLLFNHEAEHTLFRKYFCVSVVLGSFQSRVVIIRSPQKHPWPEVFDAGVPDNDKATVVLMRSSAKR